MIQQQAANTDRYAILPPLLFTALAVGFAGDVLLRSTPWGINIGLWLLVLGGALVLVARIAGLAISPARWALLGSAMLFAFGYAVRDSPILCTVNFLGMAFCIALAGFRPGPAPLNIGAVTEYLLEGPRFWLSSLFGIVPLMRYGVGEVVVDASPAELANHQVAPSPTTITLDRGGQLLRGALLAMPFLLVFGALLVSADPVFSTLGQNLLTWLRRDIVAHLAWTIAIGAVVAGMIRQLMLRREITFNPGVPQTRIAPGDVCVALAFIDALFLLFVLVQCGTFFGDPKPVLAAAHITFTQYVHRGFYELVWVAGLALPTLLFLHWLVAAETGVIMARFRFLSVAMIAEIAIVMASAVYRMLAYVHATGMTEWRLYPTVFMFWLTLVLGWFIATVLRGRRDLFMFGAITSALAVGLLLDVINPDAIVVNVNASPYLVQSAFPAKYVGQLSADAVPAIVDVLPRLTLADQDTVSGALLHRNVNWATAQSEWQSWNAGRSAAVAKIKSQRALLLSLNKTPYQDMDNDD